MFVVGRVAELKGNSLQLPLGLFASEDFPDAGAMQANGIADVA